MAANKACDDEIGLVDGDSIPNDAGCTTEAIAAAELDVITVVDVAVTIDFVVVVAVVLTALCACVAPGSGACAGVGSGACPALSVVLPCPVAGATQPVTCFRTPGR